MRPLSESFAFSDRNLNKCDSEVINQGLTHARGSVDEGFADIANFENRWSLDIIPVCVDLRYCMSV